MGATTAEWSNWSGRVRCRPRAVVRPTTEAEVVDAVRRAGADGVTVRPVGAGHSFTPLGATDGVVLDLAGLAGT